MSDLSPTRYSGNHYIISGTGWRTEIFSHDLIGTIFVLMFSISKNTSSISLPIGHSP
jgi:hypothetical protein